MDAVPFDFCYSVATLLYDPGAVQDSFDGHIWRKALTEAAENRTNFGLDIACYSGNWSYKIRHGMGSDFEFITLEELVQLDRRNLQCRRIWMCAMEGTPASFEEITRIVNYAIPFVNMATLIVKEVTDFSQRELLALLSLFNNSSIWWLWANDDEQPEAVMEVLRVHLKSPSFKKANLHHSSKRDADEFILKQSFDSFRFDFGPGFDKEFVQKLFKKQIVSKTTVECEFSFKFKKLRKFKENLQVRRGKGYCSWIRKDGVRVDVTDEDEDGLLEIQFSKTGWR